MIPLFVLNNYCCSLESNTSYMCQMQFFSIKAFESIYKCHHSTYGVIKYNYKHRNFWH